MARQQRYLTRPRPEGCWWFCGKYCPIEREGGCRDFIPDYEMPAPNASCNSICNLRFGNKNHDDAIIAWQKACSRAIKRKTEPPTHWRNTEQCSDVLENCLIYCKEHDGTPYDVWNPYLVECMVYDTAPIVDAVYKAAATYVKGQGLNKSSLSVISKKLTAMYYGRYRVQENVSDEDWPKLREHFQRSVHIVARWCIQDYFWEYEHWSMLIVKHHVLEEGWLERHEEEQRLSKKALTKSGVKFVVKETKKISTGNPPKKEKPDGHRFIQRTT